MVFARYEEHAPSYGLFLTDGYAEKPADADLDLAGASLEEWMTRRFYGLAKEIPLRARLTQERVGKMPRQPDLVHVWVIGDRSWTTRIPERLAPVAEGEQREDYRILIAASAQLSDDGRYRLPDSSVWIRKSGMARKKKHDDLGRFKRAARELLEEMRDTYSRTNRPPNSVLDVLGVPYAYFGDPVSEIA